MPSRSGTMASFAPLFASERTAAALLDMKVPEFRRLVEAGAIFGPVRIGGVERWDVEQLRRIVSGDAARPDEEFRL